MRLNKLFAKCGELMADERVLEVASVRNPKKQDELHFWGLTSGETLLLKRVAGRWVSVVKVPEPIGIATKRYHCAGPVKDHEWSKGPVINKELRKSPKLLAGAAGMEKKNKMMRVNE